MGETTTREYWVTALVNDGQYAERVRATDKEDAREQVRRLLKARLGVAVVQCLYTQEAAPTKLDRDD